MVAVIEWATIGKLFVSIGGICTAFFAILKFVSYLHSKSSIGRLEKSMADLSMVVQKHARYIDNDNVRIAKLEHQIEESRLDRQGMHDTFRILLEAVQALLKSNLEGGNNVQGMKKASEKIQDFLNSHI